MDKLIVAIHFNVSCDDIEKITEIIDKLSEEFDNIINVDLLTEDDYHADIHGEDVK